MRKPKLNHFHWLAITVAVGISIGALLIITFIYKNEIDQTFIEILNR